MTALNALSNHLFTILFSTEKIRCVLLSVENDVAPELRNGFILLQHHGVCHLDWVVGLTDSFPTFNQFRYFYRKHKKLQTFFISRNGIKSYQRNNRPLIGDGVREFAPAIGVGMLDSTICDIYLVDEANNLIGRPILTACVDAYSGLCCGYALSHGKAEFKAYEGF